MGKSSFKCVILKAGREKSLLRRHPWVFSGAVAEVKGSPSAGETVKIIDSQGRFLAKGAFSPASQILVRVWTWDENVAVDELFFRRRLKRAMSVREESPQLRNSNAYRLVHAESDGLPGLVVDRYKNIAVAQFLSNGVELWKELIVDILQELGGFEAIYERSDADVRRLEGLTDQCGLLRGRIMDEEMIIQENDLLFHVDVKNGHKTGFYLDQRPNRFLLRKLSQGKEILDCFCYNGGFALNALSGGAQSVECVDSSSAALGQARSNIILNNLAIEKVTFIEGDVFRVLREMRDRARQFDVVILDPPKFAATVSQVERAARGYKDINLLAMKLLRKGGKLLTFSCSGGVSPDLFQKIIAGAALDAGVEAQILMRLNQDVDHPVALNFPEGEYLKGLLVGIL